MTAVSKRRKLTLPVPMPLRVTVVVSNFHDVPPVNVTDVASTTLVTSQVVSALVPRSASTILSPASGP